VGGGQARAQKPGRSEPRNSSKANTLSLAKVKGLTSGPKPRRPRAAPSMALGWPSDGAAQTPAPEPRPAAHSRCALGGWGCCTEGDTRVSVGLLWPAARLAPSGSPEIRRTELGRGYWAELPGPPAYTFGTTSWLPGAQLSLRGSEARPHENDLPPQEVHLRVSEERWSVINPAPSQPLHKAPNQPSFCACAVCCPSLLFPCPAHSPVFWLLPPSRAGFVRLIYVRLSETGQQDWLWLSKSSFSGWVYPNLNGPYSVHLVKLWGLNKRISRCQSALQSIISYPPEKRVSFPVCYHVRPMQHKYKLVFHGHEIMFNRRWCCLS
jgi:hypothetical protein